MASYLQYDAGRAVFVLAVASICRRCTGALPAVAAKRSSALGPAALSAAEGDTISNATTGPAALSAAEGETINNATTNHCIDLMIRRSLLRNYRMCVCLIYTT